MIPHKGPNWPLPGSLCPFPPHGTLQDPNLQKLSEARAPSLGVVVGKLRQGSRVTQTALGWDSDVQILGLVLLPCLGSPPSAHPASLTALPGP